MKKFFAILLAATLLASMATVASAAENTTTLTTTVPAASYTLNIPANQGIEYGATKTDIGNITVTNSDGFAEGKNLKVTISWDDFTCSGVSTTIPFILEGKTGDVSLEIRSGGNIIFKGKDNGTLSSQGCSSSSNHTYQSFVVWIKSEDWGKALAGDYTTTITYCQDEDTQTQVRGRYREVLQTLFVLNYDVEIKVPTDFVGRDLFTEEKAELCAILNIHDSKGRRVGWTTVSRKLKESGYTLTERRYNSRRCVVISI